MANFRQIMIHRRGGTASGILAVLLVGAIAAIALVYGLSVAKDASDQAEAPPKDVATPAGTLPTPAVTPPTTQPGEETPAPKPPIVFSPQLVDFGVLMPREKAVASFSMRNTSDEPVKILTMKPECKCTTVQDLSGTIIEPGETVTFDAALDGRESGGSNNAAVRFVFEGFASTQVSMRAQYRRSIVSSPPFISAMEEFRSGLVQIRAEDDRVFRVLSMNGEPPRFHDFDPATDELRNRYVMQWDISMYDDETCIDVAGRRMPDFIIFETDHPGAPVVEITVRHPCNFYDMVGRGRWIPRGKHRVVDVLAPGGSTEVLIPFRWLDGAVPDDRIETVFSETVGIDAELLSVMEIKGDPTCRVKITVDDDIRGLFTARLRIHAMNSSAPFAVIGTVRESDGSDEATGRRNDEGVE